MKYDRCHRNRARDPAFQSSGLVAARLCAYTGAYMARLNASNKAGAG